jgi:hypothetical protein
VLGLTPGASDEEIAQAFAREAGPYRPRPLAELARITLAYETLRDAAKREAYDASLAPKPAPEPAPVPTLWPRDGWPFVPTVRARPAEASVAAHTAPGHEANLPRPKPAAERLPAPFIAASPASPAEPAARSDTPSREREPEPPTASQGQATPAPMAQASVQSVPDYRLDESFRDVDSSPIEWRRPALMAGGLFLGVALLGAWLGWTSGTDAQDVLPEEAVTLKVPDADAARPAVAPPPNAGPVLADEPIERQVIADAAPTRVARPSPPPLTAQPSVQEEQQAQASTSEQGRIDDIASGLAVAETQGAETAPAALPLSDAVVARTIRRIGYACGDVASTAAVEGAAPGTFKVTCTSGDSYRAAPVRGRYHFRRWGRD